MNWDKEMSKPVFATAGGLKMTLREALNTAKGAYLYESRSLQFSSRGFIKASAAKTPDVKELVIARLNADPKKVFKFLDGREFTASQAVEQVKKQTPEGEYFLKLEKRAVEIVQEALLRGDIT